MTSRLTLKAFLASARTALASPAKQSRPLTFVVGNESAGKLIILRLRIHTNCVDLDSLCSSVVMAYLRSNSPGHGLHIPLSNLQREDLQLRTEMSEVLRHADLEFSDLLTLSDLPDLKPDDTRWYLVDHNAMTGPLKKYQNRIAGCIDHHVDEEVVPLEASPRMIQHCGSCITLVIEECRQEWQNLRSKSNDDDINASCSSATEDAKIAKLSLAPILLDTVNLTAKEKMCEKDPEIAGFLETVIDDKTFDRTKFFDEISAVKEDISSLSFRDIFRKDYKQWEDGDQVLGLSCTVQNFDYLLEKSGDKELFLKELAAWSDERGLDIAGVMTTSHPNDEFQRHLLVWGRSSKGRDSLKEFGTIAKSLELETWSGGILNEDGTRAVWRQYNLKASRKQVGPLLRDAMKAVGKSKI